jgi:hypothetical protein
MPVGIVTGSMPGLKANTVIVVGTIAGAMVPDGKPTGKLPIV